MKIRETVINRFAFTKFVEKMQNATETPGNVLDSHRRRPGISGCGFLVTLDAFIKDQDVTSIIVLKNDNATLYEKLPEKGENMKPINTVNVIEILARQPDCSPPQQGDSCPICPGVLYKSTMSDRVFCDQCGCTP